MMRGWHRYCTFRQVARPRSKMSSSADLSRWCGCPSNLNLPLGLTRFGTEAIGVDLRTSPAFSYYPAGPRPCPCLAPARLRHKCTNLLYACIPCLETSWCQIQFLLSPKCCVSPFSTHLTSLGDHLCFTIHWSSYFFFMAAKQKLGYSETIESLVPTRSNSPSSH
jgi:hypothetical protein